MVVAAQQETKWFGNELYGVGKKVVLIDGGESLEQRLWDMEAKMSLLCFLVQAANGRHGAKRLVTATLEVEDGRSGCLHLLSCYALTSDSSRKKDVFFTTLQDPPLAIPSDEGYAHVVLDNFNACVGTRSIVD